MSNVDPVLLVLIFGFVASASAALGALPFAFRGQVSHAAIGLAYASAAGLMLGIAYLLISRGLADRALLTLIGTILGVAYTTWTQRYAGIRDLPPPPEVTSGNPYGYGIILQNALHSASEGLAIGLAMFLNVRLGIFLALSLALHNVAEGMALTSLLRGGGTKVKAAAGLCLVTKSPQILLAVFALAVSPVLGDGLSLALGFVSGTLLFLVLTELLPASYERARRPGIALLLSLAAGAVVLLEDFFV